jgi:hypothetical protein
VVRAVMEMLIVCESCSGTAATVFEPRPKV